MSSINGTRINFGVAATLAVVVVVFATLFLNVSPVSGGSKSSTATNSSVLRDECGIVLKKTKGLDLKFWKKFFKHWIPFTKTLPVKMQFFLFKKDFPECGREIDPKVYETFENSGFDAKHQTRIIIHGWLSQRGGSLGRDVKNAYLSLASEGSAQSNSSEPNDGPVDFNVIVVDWSVISTNANYFAVVAMIDDLAFLLSEFLRFLQAEAGLLLDDVYLIGHSLGAQIAGSAGRQMRPFTFNTIYALDPAGPEFRDRAEDFRLDAADAKYVESIMTSSSLGFQEPVGHATFYPNFGFSQKNCRKFGCSHSRSHDYFAETISSKIGFWGVRSTRQSKNIWVISDMNNEYKMGGEPSTPKSGVFLVETNDLPPYAMGRRLSAKPELAAFKETEKETETETKAEAQVPSSAR